MDCVIAYHLMVCNLLVGEKVIFGCKKVEEWSLAVKRLKSGPWL